jgi:hypothetical protein
MQVGAESSGVGLYAAVASRLSSSRTAMLLNRPSQKAPLQPSSRLARRARGSFKHFMRTKLPGHTFGVRQMMETVAVAGKGQKMVGPVWTRFGNCCHVVYLKS